MTDKKKPHAWQLEARRPGVKEPELCYTGSDKAYMLREIEELINGGYAYINVIALYPLFGSEDMKDTDQTNDGE